MLLTSKQRVRLGGEKGVQLVPGKPVHVDDGRVADLLDFGRGLGQRWLAAGVLVLTPDDEIMREIGSNPDQLVTTTMGVDAFIAKLEAVTTKAEFDAIEEEAHRVYESASGEDQERFILAADAAMNRIRDAGRVDDESTGDGVNIASLRADEAIPLIDAETDVSVLALWEEQEKAHKSRVTVLGRIVERMAALSAPPPSP